MTISQERKEHLFKLMKLEVNNAIHSCQELATLAENAGQTQLQSDAEEARDIMMAYERAVLAVVK